MFAVAEMREKKSAEEVEAMERAFLIGYHMHTLAMHMCHPGVSSARLRRHRGHRQIQRFGPVIPLDRLAARRDAPQPQRRRRIGSRGRLLLCDAGCETVDGYCSDHTRTYPVSGRFTQKQKEIYNVVLAAHDHVARIVKPHMMYTEIHNAAYMTLAEGAGGAGTAQGHGRRRRGFGCHDDAHAPRTGTRAGHGRTRLRGDGRAEFRLLDDRRPRRQVGNLHLPARRGASNRER